MSDSAIHVALGVLVLIASAAFFFFGRTAGRSGEQRRLTAAKSGAEETAQRILAEANRDAENQRKTAVLAGKEELIRLREAWEVEARGRREEIEREERRLQEKETQLERKADVVDQRDKELGRRGSEL